MNAPAGPPARLFEVVLHEPEIPNNTGNIGRTCVATGCGLSLVHPLGFDVTEKACRRAGLDYWPRLGVREFRSWDDYEVRARPPRLWLFSTHGVRSLFDAAFEPGDHLVFGRETRGLPPWLLDRYPARTLVLPMVAGERSLNLATAVCAAVYEGVRQMLARGRLGLDAGLRMTTPPPG
ncbi:MAG: tRNA (cytidine(34)-2'-O)-methyltransferase [Phycisphaeraceae bacterium]|nr:MAG: tRNA (cytidine(34)-2'-O)-methyltransferase [Phycisphaeraceae bacterium]